MLAELEKYLKETPREEVLKTWEKVKNRSKATLLINDVVNCENMATKEKSIEDPMTYAGCANPKKEKFEPQGKYEYDVFYTLEGEMMTGYTRGDNQKHATENFFVEYEERAKIKHFQRYPLL